MTRSTADRPGLSGLLRLLACLALLAFAAPATAAVFYVSNELGELDPAQKVRVAEPRPVQLLFGFQTDGTPNSRATNFTKTRVEEQVRASQVFSEVGAGPAADGALLNVTINNITERNAAGRGFAVGLTFGLHGTAVTDRYEITFQYVARAGAAPVTRTVRHAIITTIGRTSPPENATRARNAEEALTNMVRQAMARGLNDLAGDPAFGPAAPAAQPAPAQP